MILHMLSGDCLADAVRGIVAGDTAAVLREALADGPLPAIGDPEFAAIRSGFNGISEDEYRRGFVSEVAKFRAPGLFDEICLWFGDDVFCQVNMWFCLSTVAGSEAHISRVFPASLDFGGESAGGLRSAMTARVRFEPSGIDLGRKLWDGFRLRDHNALASLRTNEARGFRGLSETVDAAIAIDERPRIAVENAVATFGDDFEAVFRYFSRNEPIYGFGDRQVRRLFDLLRG
jgi:hypothetical protein